MIPISVNKNFCGKGLKPWAVWISVIIVHLVATSLLAGANAIGFIAGDLSRTSELLTAPVIIVGQVDALAETGRDTVSRGSRIEVNVSQAAIKPRFVLKGNASNGKVLVGSLFTPVNRAAYIGRQVPRQGKRYVFFLMKGKENEYIPAIPAEFALEVVDYPDEIGVQHLEESLRAIARLNVHATNDYVSLRWAAFLSDLYRDADEPYWRSMTKDPRKSIRGAAFVTLAEHRRFGPQFAEDVMAYLNETADIGQLWTLRRRLSKCLPAMAGPNGPSQGDLSSWMNSRAREAQEAALDWFINEKRVPLPLEAEIRELLRRSRNKDIQYDCVRALSLTRTNRAPGYNEFMAHSEEYIEEW